MRRVYPAWLRSVLIVLGVVVLVGLAMVNYRLSLQIPGGNDFLARWTGAHYWVVEGMDPYDEEVSLAAQKMFYGRPADPTEGESLAHFYYPLYSMLFFAPFGLLPFTVARALWMTLIQIGLPVLLLMGLRIANWRPPPFMLAIMIMFSVVWYPGLRTIFVGQFAVFEALLMIGALLAIRQERDWLAGILLALSTAKPQMPILLIPFVLLWAISRKRWQLIVWSALALIVLFVVSLALIPDWPLKWIWQIMDYAQYTKPGQPVAIIANIFPNAAPMITTILTGIFILYLLWEWWMAWNKDDHWFQWTAAMTIVITNLVAFRTATTNYVVMLPALCIIFGTWSSRWSRRGALAVIISVLALTIGEWTLFLSTVDGNDESLVMYLPLPVLALAGLWWVRWWSIRPRKLPLEGTMRERLG